ncbi:sensor histidine kinase [Methylovirgula sp. 4M-Z18]|nr:sensor histidine kinase [Methylovirgula sp. 4M-Z18]
MSSAFGEMTVPFPRGQKGRRFGSSLLIFFLIAVLILGVAFGLSNWIALPAVWGWLAVAGGISILCGLFILLHRNRAAEETRLADQARLIAELERAKAQSDEARWRAEEASLAKSRFLAAMSHELRTPLNVILGFSEVLRSEIFGPHHVPAYKDYANDIHSSGTHLLELINEIVDLSRIEAGRHELREEAVSLVTIAEDCLRLLTLRAKSRNLTIEAKFEPSLPNLWADERAMRQVVLNLLNNAVKFTPPGGSVQIKIGWTATGGQYISVKDTGPGIPAEEIPLVLSSFGRGSLAEKSAVEGSGLGLPIVKGLTELHGGSFSLKSQVQVGTEAIVVLPAARIVTGE